MKGTKPPFDVGDLRVIRYEDKLGGEKDTGPEIQRMLRAVIASRHEDSPVFQAIPELGGIARTSAEAEARIGALEAEARELRVKLAVAEQVGLNFRETLSAFERTVGSLMNRLSPQDRQTAETVVQDAMRSSPEPGKTVELGPQEIDPNAVFVLMPLREEMAGVYKLINSTASDMGLRVWRADDIAVAGPITEQIFGAIAKSRLIIADVTGRNPNVLYEIGIAHALKKDILLIAQKGESLPFDIANVRVLFYEQSVSGANDLRQRLQGFLRALLLVRVHGTHSLQ